MKFLCEQCKAKYQIADDKIVGRTVRMKCRKCGYLIEMRAAVTESGASSAPPPPGPVPASAPSPSPAKPPGKAMPPRATPLAASLTAHRPAAPKPDRLPSALAGAFKTTVQREEEVSAPFDMSELSPGNDWYVAIHGVPVGPVRVAEIRRKASMGAVTEDSLVWQEGLDEWRPLRTFPDLAAIVREAASGTRSSVLPAPGSTPPPRPVSAWPAPPQAPHRPAPQRISPAVNAAASARSNVVAITSRLATAEKLEEPQSVGSGMPQPGAMAALTTETRALPAVVADPFAPAPAAQAAVAAAASPSVPPVYRQQKGPPVWILLILLMIAAAFGITMAIAFVIPRNQPQAVVVQVPAPTATPPANVSAQGAALGTASAGSENSPVVIAANTPSSRVPSGSQGASKASPSATASGRTLDLHGIGTGPVIAPVDDTGNEGPKAAGQCMSEGQVGQVIGLHQVAIRRSCWERSSTTKTSVNISVALTVGADGSAQNVAASGDDPSVAKCIENDVRGWHFPAMGCTQKTGFSFKFVRQ